MIRFKTTTSDSFFGNFLYDQILDPKHFLVRARNEIRWSEICSDLVLSYKGGGEFGPAAYPPDLLLRYLLIPYLFNISERQAEEMVSVNLLAKYFVGLGVDQPSPDHSTLTVFKKRISQLKGGNIWNRLFVRVLRKAKRLGIVFGTVQIIDSTHTTANVNLSKDNERKKNGKPPHDPDAKFGVKRVTNEIKKDSQGQTTNFKNKKSIYGYKAHTSINAKTKLITALTVTGANSPDGQEFIPLVKKDRKVNHKINGYTADKGYDDINNHNYCTNRKIFSAIVIKNNRKQKHWLDLKDNPTYQQLTKLRPQIEAKFGEEKQQHGFDLCRYIGIKNYQIQASLTAITVNLKRMMSLTSPCLAYG